MRGWPRGLGSGARGQQCVQEGHKEVFFVGFGVFISLCSLLHAGLLPLMNG